MTGPAYGEGIIPSTIDFNEIVERLEALRKTNPRNIGWKIHLERGAGEYQEPYESIIIHYGNDLIVTSAEDVLKEGNTRLLFWKKLKEQIERDNKKTQGKLERVMQNIEKEEGKDVKKER